MQELEDQLKEKSESNNELAKKVEDLERENASQQITASDLREFSRSLESELNERCKQEHVLQEVKLALNSSMCNYVL